MEIDLISGLSTTSSALSVYRRQMDLVAENIANAQVTDVDGKGPYKKQRLDFSPHLETAKSGKKISTLKVNQVRSDETPGPMIYDPGHPHANENGMVRMPNVSQAREMVDLLNASRAYEANLAVVKTLKGASERSLSIGK